MTEEKHDGSLDEELIEEDVAEELPESEQGSERSEEPSADEDVDGADESEEPAADEEDIEEADEDVDDADESEEPSSDEDDDEAEPLKKKLSIGKRVAIVIAAVLVLILAGCCVALAIDDADRTQYVPANTILDAKIDISGMTEGELRDLLVHRDANGLSTTVNLNVAENTYQFDMGDIGTVDIDGTIDQAFSPYGGNIFARWFNRVVTLAFGDDEEHDVSIKCAVDPELLDAQIAQIAAQADREPQNAGYEYDEATRTLKARPALVGVQIDQPETASRVAEIVSDASNGSITRLMIDADAVLTDAESDEYGQAILVDTIGCYTRLYENGAEVKSYRNSPGKSGYATPKGDFFLSYKDPAPTWVNPHSSWSQNMAETIAPGPSNPLGLRALAVSCGGGIYLHGTTSTGALGSRASHGCIRHSNSDIIDLYDRVEVGIPIIIR